MPVQCPLLLGKSPATVAGTSPSSLRGGEPTGACGLSIHCNRALDKGDIRPVLPLDCEEKPFKVQEGGSFTMTESLPSTRHGKMLFLVVISDDPAHTPPGLYVAPFYAEETEVPEKRRNLPWIEEISDSQSAAPISHLSIIWELGPHPDPLSQKPRGWGDWGSA